MSQDGVTDERHPRALGRMVSSAPERARWGRLKAYPSGDVLRKLGMSSPRSGILSKLGGAGPTHRRYSRQEERDLPNVES